MDAIVVFDPAGKFVRTFGKEYHGGGHGIDIRKEGGEEFLYLCDVKHGLVTKTDAQGRARLDEGPPAGAGRLQRPGREVQPDERRLRPRRRLLHRRRLRLALHPPVRQGRQVGPHLGRRRRTSPARCRRRTASGSTTAPAASRRSSSPTAPTPGCNTSRSTASTSSFVERRQLPRPLRHPRRRAARPRPARPRHALRQGQQGHHPPRLRRGVDRSKSSPTASRCAASPPAGSPASSSTRTTPASTRTATSSSSSGCRRGG